MPQACRALQEQEAPQALKGTKVTLVNAEAPEVLGLQGLLEPRVHRELQVPGDPQD